jgi:hypothetical protein
MVPVMKAKLAGTTVVDQFSLAMALVTVRRHAQELAVWFKDFPWERYDFMYEFTCMLRGFLSYSAYQKNYPRRNSRPTNSLSPDVN